MSLLTKDEVMNGVAFVSFLFSSILFNYSTCSPFFSFFPLCIYLTDAARIFVLLFSFAKLVALMLEVLT